MDKLSVAALQMNSTSDPEQNLATALDLIRQASNAGAKLIVLPEFFIRIGNTNTELHNLAEEIGIGKIQDSLKAIAQECNICLVAGTIPIKSKTNSKYYNTTLVYNSAGEMLCYYHKIHLFKLNSKEQSINEADTFIAGQDIVTFNLENFSFGLAICYDLRFPELFREMSGVDAIILPAAFTQQTGKAHWEILLRARAIENQCYVIASAQTGTHDNNRQTYGHSMIINPWGEIEALQKQGSGCIASVITKNTVDEVRAKLPALQHRRF